MNAIDASASSAYTTQFSLAKLVVIVLKRADGRAVDTTGRNSVL